MSPALERRAVVAGSGMAGIAAAAALGRAGYEVTLVDRDEPGAGAPRAGTPQDRQLHNLLSCGQHSLDRLLPGFCDSLRAAGGSAARVSTETEVYELGVRMPSRDLGMRLMCAPRPLIERVARELLSKATAVRVLDGARVVGLEREGETLRGAVVETESGRRLLPAPVVVDASGSRGSGRRWLREAGAEEPEATTRRVARWYASAEFGRTPEAGPRDRFWLVFPTPPGQRGGLVSPSGPGRWQVSFSGGFADTAPRTPADMVAYAETLEVPWIADLLRDAQPLGSPSLFRKPWAVWRRYERLRRPLPGFLPLGDAVAALNPLFGQGISVAARQALGLAELLEPPAARADLARLTAAHCGRAAEIVASAWALGEMVEAPASAGAAEEEPALLARSLREDPDLHHRYVAMWHLMEPVSSVRAALRRSEALR